MTNLQRANAAYLAKDYALAAVWVMLALRQPETPVKGKETTKEKIVKTPLQGFGGGEGEK